MSLWFLNEISLKLTSGCLAFLRTLNWVILPWFFVLLKHGKESTAYAILAFPGLSLLFWLSMTSKMTPGDKLIPWSKLCPFYSTLSFLVLVSLHWKISQLSKVSLHCLVCIWKWTNSPQKMSLLFRVRVIMQLKVRLHLRLILRNKEVSQICTLKWIFSTR